MSMKPTLNQLEQKVKESAAELEQQKLRLQAEQRRIDDQQRHNELRDARPMLQQHLKSMLKYYEKVDDCLLAIKELFGDAERNKPRRVHINYGPITTRVPKLDANGNKIKKKSLKSLVGMSDEFEMEEPQTFTTRLTEQQVQSLLNGAFGAHAGIVTTAAEMGEIIGAQADVLAAKNEMLVKRNESLVERNRALGVTIDMLRDMSVSRPPTAAATAERPRKQRKPIKPRARPAIKCDCTKLPCTRENYKACVCMGEDGVLRCSYERGCRYVSVTYVGSCQCVTMPKAAAESVYRMPEQPPSPTATEPVDVAEPRAATSLDDRVVDDE